MGKDRLDGLGPPREPIDIGHQTVGAPTILQLREDGEPACGARTLPEPAPQELLLALQGHAQRPIHCFGLHRSLVPRWDKQRIQGQGMMADSAQEADRPAAAAAGNGAAGPRPPLLPPHKPKTGRPAVAHRRILNGILWLLRTGAPWRDLPERYGPWGTVASRLYRWRKAGLWARLLAAVQQQADGTGQLDWDTHYVDGTIIRAHQHAAGALTGNADAEALGRQPRWLQYEGPRAGGRARQAYDARPDAWPPP